MKQLFTLVFFFISIYCLSAQNVARGDYYSANQKMVSIQNGWIRVDNDASGITNSPALGNENVSYFGTSEGIFVSVISGTNYIKLYALTGQLLSYGILSQGRYFTPTRQGIYFLKINNKAYKVICK